MRNFPEKKEAPLIFKKKNLENRITPEYLRVHCQKNDLYMTPHFNTVLYLHFKVELK